MPLYIDIHKHIPGLTRDAVAGAHRQDLATQDKHDVDYMKYWFNDRTGDVFCLVRAPSREAAIRVHEEAHGLVADDIFEVEEGT